MAKYNSDDEKTRFLVVSLSRCGRSGTTAGGMSTLVASYLARMRGSNEPELSITRAKDLDQFIRECDAFQMDRGHITGNSEDSALEGFRKRFEELLGNANGWVLMAIRAGVG